jgi:hypothetical protein
MTSESEIGDTINVPLNWHIPDEIISRYATNMTIQQGENEFIISFFEVIPPILLGSPEVRAKKIEKLEEINAECVARVIVAADKLPAFIKAMQSNLEIYKARVSPDEDKDD